MPLETTQWRYVDTINARRTVNEIELMMHPMRHERELFLNREIYALVQQADMFERLPGWLQLAKVRQGSE